MTTGFMSPRLLVEALCKRFSLTGPCEPIDASAPAILAHIETLEADAREAHSAAKALGCTVADLADRAKEQHRILTETAKALDVSITGVLGSRVSALVRDQATLADMLGKHHALLTRCLELLGQPNADSYDVVPDLIEGLLAKPTPDPDLRQQLLTVLHRVNAALPPAHQGMVPISPEHAADVIGNVGGFVAHHGHTMEALRLLAGEVHDARKALSLTDPHAHIAPTIRALQIEARHAAPMSTTLQAIAEALPAELRYTEDIAGAVRQLVLTSQTNYGLYQQVQEEVAPHKQIVGILRELLEVSRPLCLAMVRELWSDDEALQDLLTTVSAERLAATLMESLAVPHDQPIPTTTPPTPQAKALEGPVKVAYFGHSRRAGRIEAIGGDLIRFYPAEGDPVTLNANRRDLEVYQITPEKLAEEVARIQARNAPAATTQDAPAPDPADDDIPF